MLFENNNYDFDVLSLAGFNFEDPTKYFEYPEKLVDTKEGFFKGNMFKKEYIPYKNRSPIMLKPTCEKETMLYKIMELNFSINDLNLYLDLHPEDRDIYEKFKKYTKEYLQLKDEYAKKYGPLTLNQIESNTYEWMKNPWPWDQDGGSMYV